MNDKVRYGLDARLAPAVAALVVLALLAGYGGTGFVLDDSFLLARAAHRFGFESLDFALRTTDHRIHLWVHQDPVVFQFFRPFTALSLWIERRIWDTNAWGYHLTNIALHLANAGMLWRLAMRCGLRRGPALLGAVAWAIGLQTIPAVGWISGRTELLWSFGALLSTHALLRWRSGRHAAWYVVSLIASAFAACAKETGLVTPLLGWLVLRGSTSPRSDDGGRVLTAGRVAGLFVPAAVVLAVRLATIGLSLPPEPYVDVPHRPVDLLWVIAKPVLYLGAGLLSLPLSHWGPLEWMHTHPWSLAVFVPVTLLATWGLARAAGRASVGLGLGWFALALLPVMAVRPTSLYLYVPMMGLAMLIASGWQRRGGTALAAWLAALSVAGGGAHLFTQNFIGEVWASSKQQVETLDRWVAAGGSTRVIAIDTPVWLYALPASIELNSPELRFDTWFVNFKPRLDAVEGSSVRWRNALQLEVTAPPGGFLHSVFEQFLAFGGTPVERPGRVAQPVEVAIEGPRTRPARLVITFRDEGTRDSALIVCFTRRGVRSVAPFASPVAGMTREGTAR